jgi:NOL1/NOP2/fmu family ribosome biogenesis protein
MQKLKILNSKEIKQIMNMLKEQYGFNEKPDYVFLKSSKEKIYIINRNMANIDLTKLRIDSMGLYFGGFQKDGFRLSIEGSQIIGKKAKKGIINLDDKQKTQWLKGEDITYEGEGYVIVKNKQDILGSGKIKDNKLLNYIPKARKLVIVND